MSDRVDCVVIGAGVIGLAVGRALALSGREVVVIERNAHIGEETSSRNSEVIHAGLYYPTGSLKARLCVAGKAMLYDYCERRQVRHRRCGKLVVASSADQLDTLAGIADCARRNGVVDMQELDAHAIARREPEVAGVAALLAPSTGIVDSHALMLALEGDIEAAGGIVAVRTTVRRIDVGRDAVRLRLVSHDEESELLATTVVNAAGLGAGLLAADCAGVDNYATPPIHFAKGNYFRYQGASPFRSLIYPLPTDGGLGIHATLDLGGRLRFGPDVEWVEAIDYAVTVDRKSAFAESIRNYWPGLNENLLVPGYAGIRPRLAGPAQAWADFRIDVAAAGPGRQLIHLLGIESPGLTAALALAEEVQRRTGLARAR
jgi:L-2-hydroxyglutarate oxidase LhgO